MALIICKSIFVFSKTQGLLVKMYIFALYGKNKNKAFQQPKVNNTMKTKQKKIDNNDKKILSIIARDARVPLKDVAKVCNMSRAAVHQRVLRMIEGGVITGSRYDVSPQCVGYSTCTYVGISLDRGSRYQSVVDQLNKIPEIVECHFTTGPYTMLVKLYARDNAHLMDLLNHQIQKIVGVISTETLISLEQSINKPLLIEYD